MGWVAEDLCASLSKGQNGDDMKRENELLGIYSPLVSPEAVVKNRPALLQRPGLVVDSGGRVLVWVLPDIMLAERQVRSYRAS